MMQIGMAECGQCGERRECYSGDNGAECGACYVDAIAHGAMHGSFADYDDETSVARDSNALRHFQEEIDNVIPPKSITWHPCKSPERCYCHGCGELVSRRSERVLS